MTGPVNLRREIHRNPERSGCETGTAQRLLRFFEPLRPDRVIEGLGGTGIAFVFSGTQAGPTILLRSELDALPIHEVNEFDHRSLHDGTSHKCGHDGHMAILAAVGEKLSKKRPARGRVVLLYQPAEETGQGAAA
ncbi:MAG: M20/M25/M40 family metallo-hydrolase, partial [Gammaproteobacteria bacterium]|nr:M20/M25/M40 family metallo-hydrolase [Gammaproteobacteria bacterium]